MNFAQKLRAARVAAGMTMSDLARATGTAPSFVSQLESERGGRAVGPKTAERFAAALGITLGELLGERPAPKTRPFPRAEPARREHQQAVAELVRESPPAYVAAVVAIMKARKAARP